MPRISWHARDASPVSCEAVGSNEFQRQSRLPGDFADTVQSEPPASAIERAACESLPAADSDVGLDIGNDSESIVAEKPTLSHIGRYALKTLLGEGGLGCVYEAWDPLLSRTVAVKTLQFDLDMPSRIALDRMLLNEARAAANLSHAHIVTVYDAGLSAHGVYIAMERLRGHDLRQRLADGWQPTPEAAAQIVRRVADALAYAHARGVVHCDVKPGNIFLTRKDKPKVLDFGIARAAHATAPPSSEAPIAGSPHYLAPEQLSGSAVDARADIYSLGVVLYELLAGRKAFRGETLEQIHAAVRTGHATPLQELRPELPRALCDTVARAMDLEPDRRFATASELSQALRHWASKAQADSTPADGASADPTIIPRRRPLGWVIGAASVCAAVAVWWLLGAAPVPPPAAAPVAAAVAPGVVAPVAVQTVAAPPTPLTPVTTAETGASVETIVPTPGVKPAPRTAAAKPRTVAAVADTPAAQTASGTLQIAVSPWGEIEVDGRPAGTTPPLTQLSLPEGKHSVTIRNTDFPPHTTSVQVQADKAVVVRHRFGS